MEQKDVFNINELTDEERNDYVKSLVEIGAEYIKEKLIVLQNELKSKYDEDFNIAKFFNEIENESLLVCEESNTGIRFLATINIETDEVTDTYIQTVMSDKLSREIRKELLNTNAEFWIRFIGDDIQYESNINIELDEFFEIYNINEVFAYVVISDKDISSNGPNEFINAIKTIAKKYNIDISIFGNTLADDYQEALTKLKEVFNITKDSFDEFNPIKKVAFAIENGDVNTSYPIN